MFGGRGRSNGGSRHKGNVDLCQYPTNGSDSEESFDSDELDQLYRLLEMPKERPGVFSLFVGNVPHHVKEEDIRQLFECAGEVVGVFKKGRGTGMAFAFVHFAVAKDALRAIRMFDEQPPLNLVVRLSHQRAKEPEIESSLNLSCFICKSPAGYWCRCGLPYCGATCQRIHWPNHKPDCIPPAPLENVPSPNQVFCPPQPAILPPAIDSPSFNTPPPNENRSLSRPQARQEASTLKPASARTWQKDQRPGNQRAEASKSVKEDERGHGHDYNRNRAPMGGVRHKVQQSPNGVEEKRKELGVNSSCRGFNNLNRPNQKHENAVQEEKRDQEAKPVVMKPIEPSKLPKSRRIVATVTHVVNPQELWVQLDENKTILKEIYVMLAKCPKNSIKEPRVGDFCLAPFEGTWNRVVIESVQGSKATALYLDYGNNEEVDLSELKFMPALLRNQPRQAIRIGLAGIVDGFDDWRSEQLDLFNQVVCNLDSDDILLLNVEVLNLEIRGVPQVKLSDMEGLVVNHIVTQLIPDLVIDPKMLPPEDIPAPEATLDSNEEEENIKITSQETKTEISKMRPLENGMDDVPPALISSNIESIVGKPVLSTGEQKYLPKDEFEALSWKLPSGLVDVPLTQIVAEIGQKPESVVPKFEEKNVQHQSVFRSSLKRIALDRVEYAVSFVSAANPPITIVQLFLPVVVNSARALLKDLADCKDKPALQRIPVVNEVLVGEYEGDWFRAVINRVSEEEKRADVTYVDYGNEGSVGFEDLKELPESAVQRPICCHVVQLKDVPKCCGDNSQVMDMLQSKIDNAYDMKVIDATMDPPLVELDDADSRESLGTQIQNILKASIKPPLRMPNTPVSGRISKTPIQSPKTVEKASSDSPNIFGTPVGTPCPSPMPEEAFPTPEPIQFTASVETNNENTVKTEDKKTKFVFSGSKLAVPSEVQGLSLLVCSAEDPMGVILTLADAEMLGKLTELGVSFAEAGEGNEPDPDFTPESEELVIAYGSEYGEWARAVVLTEMEPNVFKVMFVDFGNTEDVHKEKIRPMQEKFMEIPFLAATCHLKGFEEGNDKINQKLKELLPVNSLVTANILSCEEGYYEVELPSVMEGMKEAGLIK